MPSVLKLMCVLAHPDDESIALGGTLARYSHEGVEISLVVATRGERGWFSDWHDYPGEQELGRIRERELREACKILGVKRLELLNYIDGTVDQANESEIIAQLVYLIRDIRPHVVITFGPEGLYGHPDHIAISQFTTSALMCAADNNYRSCKGLPPHCVPKLYYRISPSEWFTDYMPIFGEIVMWIDGKERRPPTLMDWMITTRLDTNSYSRDVWQAVRCHRSQLPEECRLQIIAEEMHRRLWGSQEYYRVFSLVNGGRKEEHDLFEGLRMERREYVDLATPMLVTPLSYS